MKKIIYTVNALISIFSLVYLSQAIETIRLAEILGSGIFGYALISEILVSIIVIVLAIVLFANRIKPSKSLDIFGLIFLFFGVLNSIPRLMQMSYFVNDLFCAGKIASVCTGNGIIAVLSNASIATAVYAQFIFLILVIIGLYTTFKRKTA
jgi:hypothetical protein